MAEGVDELPDGKFHPPMGLSCAEWQVKSRVKAKLGWTVTSGRAANITKRSTVVSPATTAVPASRAA
jgi:hypothetical protein